MQFYDSGEYRASQNWPYAIAAGCVVYRTNENNKPEILLLRRKAGHINDPDQLNETYSLPKGHLELGESLEQTALRETKEEAAVEVELITYLGATVREFTHPRHKIDNIKVMHYFAARWLKDLSVIDHEHDGKEWFLLERAEYLLSAPSVKRGEASLVKRLKNFLELCGAA